MAVEQSPTREERRKVEERLESLLGPNWRNAPAEETLDVLPHLWRHLREFEQTTPSYPRAARVDAVSDPLPEEQRWWGRSWRSCSTPRARRAEESDELRPGRVAVRVTGETRSRD